MSNPAFPNLLKIGKSKKDPTTDRVNELNQTGVPEPFKVEYYAFVEDEDYLERVVHQEFAFQRPNINREFFSVKCIEAIEAIRRLSEPHCKIKYEEIYYESPEEIARYQWEQEQLRRAEEEAFERQKKVQEAEAEKLRMEQEVEEQERRQRSLEELGKRVEEEDSRAFFKYFLIGMFLLWILVSLTSS